MDNGGPKKNALGDATQRHLRAPSTSPPCGGWFSEQPNREAAGYALVGDGAEGQVGERGGRGFGVGRPRAAAGVRWEEAGLRTGSDREKSVNAAYRGGVTVGGGNRGREHRGATAGGMAVAAAGCGQTSDFGTEGTEDIFA